MSTPRFQSFAALTRTTALFAAVASAQLMAGPLSPPAGAVAPTPGPEPRTAINATNTPGDADSIFRITQPGSYYLTGNITGVSGKRGIEIAAANVTVDLNGFTLTGVTGSLNAVGADTSSSDRSFVFNGKITGWPGGGIQLYAGARIKDITVSNNTGTAVLAGTSSIVESCMVKGNTGTGIFTDAYSQIRDCISSGNGGAGIWSYTYARVDRCISTTNGGVGIDISTVSTVTGCTASDNVGDGISISDQSSVFDCDTSSNGGAGINTTWGATVARCTSYVNIGAGIRAGAYSRVEGNTCRYNGSGALLQAGILVPSGNTHAVIMNNTCTGNDYGIRIDGTLCLIKGNTCSSNTTTNFEIVASNRVATILTLPVNAAAISGSAGGSPISDPDANYAY